MHNAVIGDSPILRGLFVLLADMPWYFMAFVPFWHRLRMKRHRIIFMPLLLALPRVAAGFLMVSALENWRTWDVAFSILYMAVMLAGYAYCFKVSLVKIIYTMLLLQALATGVNTIAYTSIMVIFKPSIDANMANSPAYVAAAVVLLIILFPFLFRFFKNSIRQAFAELSDRDVAKLCVAPVLFYVTSGIQHSMTTTVSEVFDAVNIIVWLLILTTGIVTHYIHLRLIIDLALRRQTEGKLGKLDEQNRMLDSLNHMKTELLQNISHELKTPLTIISTDVLNVEDQLDYGMDRDDVRESLRNAQRVIMQMAKMVENTMKVASMRQPDEQMEPVDMSGLLRLCTEIYRPMLVRRKNVLTVDIPADLPAVMGQEDMIMQVVLNLLSNANKHTSGEVISVAALADGNTVSVTVRDTGEGVAPDLLPHVFKRGVTTGGTGLGLSICQSIIENHGGEIKMESKPGEGAAVTFTLPVNTRGDYGDNT